MANHPPEPVDLTDQLKPTDVEIAGDEPTGSELARIAVAGRSFDFWKEPAEDIYTLSDGEPL
jgi:hypothetical protein